MGKAFLPLERAIEERNRQLNWDKEYQDYRWRDYWLPIFMLDPREYYFVLCSKNNQKSSPVIKFFELSEPSETRVYYDSITNMMLTILDCYESGLYSEEFDWTEEEVEQLDAVRRKYNPNASL